MSVTAETRNTALRLLLLFALAMLWAVYSFLHGHTVPRTELEPLSILGEAITATVVFIGYAACLNLSRDLNGHTLLRWGFALLFLSAFQDFLDELVLLDYALGSTIEDLGMPAGFVLLSAGLLQVERGFRREHELLGRIQAREKRLCAVDQLTQLMSRRQFFKITPNLMQQCEEQGKTVSTLVFNLSNLETINLDHGHQTGDKVLQQFAKLLRKNLAPEHLSARLSGRQFALLLIDMLPEEAEQLALRIEKNASAMIIETEYGDERVLKVSVKHGLAQASGHDSIDCLLNRTKTVTARDADNANTTELTSHKCAP